jgi:hypothetical protein
MVLVKRKSILKERTVWENCGSSKRGKTDQTANGFVISTLITFKHILKIPVSETSAKLGGIGHFRIVVEDNLIPYGSDRMGVACSEANGSICG